MNSTPSASRASNTGMMCGSSTAAGALDSRMNRCRNPASAASAGARTFSAAGLPRRSSRARNTTAIPPWPIWLSSRYPAIRKPAPTLTATYGMKPSAPADASFLTTPAAGGRCPTLALLAGPAGLEFSAVYPVRLLARIPADAPSPHHDRYHDDGDDDQHRDQRWVWSTGRYGGRYIDPGAPS